ncbi:bacteriophage abortive infection AbiH family protein [Fructilactobacillus myrtifloralis]|uniref:Bacteriophage abortive infection AbiH family protein n=1 Tax=Fructilactobacillus myrtifloralis TaxID=2940301 RepID=A0ABY5BTH1_9LACO|nr:AbiH family protein [Fructilactobacillus myrtifloralis]USS85563.1 bacteriophage abortive infection AbiH family protein [Fructilactobacillus myrtifloralis]
MNRGKNIVIIGNGFDLMHDLDTSFKSFVEKTFDYKDKYILERIKREAIIFRIEELVSPKNNEDMIKKMIINEYINQVQGGNDWYDLETILRDSMFYEYKHINDKYDRDGKDGKKKPLQYNKIIDRWREKLRRYLKEQENENKNIKFNKIEAILQDADKIITFNYTDTLEKNYNVPSEKINYFHGSINEDFVFGYSPDKVPKSGERSLNNLYDNDDYQYKSVNLSSDVRAENPEEIHIDMISPMKSIQRFILWAKQSEEYKDLSKKELVEIFFPDVNNYDPQYRFFLELIDDAFMMKNPFKPTDNIAEDPKGNIAGLRSKLKQNNNKSLDALNAYFEDKQSLNIEEGDDVTITIIGHDYASDVDIKMFITEAVGCINRIDYYYFISEKDDGGLKEDSRREEIRKALAVQFGSYEDKIMTKKMNDLKGTT